MPFLVSIQLSLMLMVSSIPKSYAIDKPFAILTAAQMLSAVNDAESTRSWLRHSPGAYELDPLYGQHPSGARLYGEMMGINLGMACLGYYLKSKHKSSWYFPQSLMIGVHNSAALSNWSRR